MNILILGGLLLLGIAAIVVAVVLLLGEQRAEKVRAATVAPSTPAASPMALEASRPRPARTTQRLAPSTPVRQSVPTAPARETPLQARADEQQHFALNGQFHELAAELRTLYQQASDLEQRLRTLSEIADRVEESQTTSTIDFEEEAPSRFDNTAP